MFVTEDTPGDGGRGGFDARLRARSQGVYMMESMDDRRLANMENTIARWKRGSESARTCLVGAIFLGVVLTVIFSGKTERLIIWIICAVSCALFTVCDFLLQRYIAEGERQLYNAQMELIERKERLASIGVLDFNAAASRRLLGLNAPDGKMNFPLALYIITDGLALAGMIYALIRVIKG